jgi:hypothetical protein
MFSRDRKVLAKLISRFRLLERVISVPGDIVEVGVFKGSGMLSFLKLKEILLPCLSPLKVIGFDYFNSDSLFASLKDSDRTRMEDLFVGRKFSHETGAEDLIRDFIREAGFGPADFELHSGDVAVSIPEFISKRPGFRARLVYIDVDIEQPTFEALRALWERVPRGGIVAFDEYGVHQWSEAIGADNFFRTYPGTFIATNVPCPTAYLVKD